MTDEQLRRERLELHLELREWIETDPKRADLIVSERLMSKSTLQQTLCGRYVPSSRTTRAVRRLMASLSPKVKKSALAV